MSQFVGTQSSDQREELNFISCRERITASLHRDLDLKRHVVLSKIIIPLCISPLGMF